MSGRLIAVSCAVVLVMLPATAQAASRVSGDFNGDGYDDLAIGVPEEDHSGAGNAGAVNVIYGAASGLGPAGNQFFSQADPALGDPPESGDRFGDTVATGDFNNDGYSDLAIGVPREDVGSAADAGAVHVLYGSPAGLTASGSQFWTQDSPGIEDGAEAGDRFGTALSAGRSRGALAPDDLAIGARFEDVRSVRDAGAVNVIYGSVSGLTAAGSQFWHQDRAWIKNIAEDGDRFGTAVSWGDFNGDGSDDLAITVPREDTKSTANAGAAAVIYGSGAGLDSAGNQLWHQDSPGIEGTALGGDMIGSSLATGDFNGDTRDDLAIGFDGDNVDGKSHTGGANVIYGSATGLDVPGNQFLSQNYPGIEDVVEGGDTWAWAMTAGDFNGDGLDDLAVGARREDIGSITNAGGVNVIPGSTSGLTGDGDAFVSQDTPGVEDDAEAGDEFGAALSAADFNGDGRDDLAVGVYMEDIAGVANSGAINVLYDALAPASSPNQFWHQDSPGILDRVEDGDRFSYALPM